MKYQITPSWRVRVGRVLAPVLMDSEFRAVGYANTRNSPDMKARGEATNINGWIVKPFLSDVVIATL